MTEQDIDFHHSQAQAYLRDLFRSVSAQSYDNAIEAAHRLRREATVLVNILTTLKAKKEQK